MIQEIAAGDLVGDTRRTDRRQRGPGHSRQRGDGDRQRNRRSLSSATYQWQVFNGTSWANISGATNATYTPAEADEGKALQVVVTYAGDAAGSESTTVSAGTVQEIAAGDLAATLSGLTGANAVQGTAVSVATVTDNGTDVHLSATYQWQVCQRLELDQHFRGDERNLHAGRGRRRQGAAGGGDLCR